MPDWIMLRSTAGDADEGPIVQTMRVLLITAGISRRFG
jgi:hypothetical protein